MKITGKTLSIVTGATGGLGKAISKMILDHQGHLLFVARDEEKIQAFVNQLDLQQGLLLHTACANLEEEQGTNLVQSKIGALLDRNRFEEIYLFNNASIIDPIGLIKDVSYSDLLKALNVNIASSYALTSGLLRLKNKGKVPGKINVINISSGVSVNAVAGWSAYCISKAGLNMLSKCVACEYPDCDVFSLSINPGPIDTGMQLKIRTADAENIPATRKFETMFTEGKLQTPDSVAQKMFRILAADDFSNGSFIDFNKIN